MNYRIIKKHRRDEETAKVKYTFQVQHYVQLFWSRKMAWKPMTVRHSYGGLGSITYNVEFDTFEKAHEYIDNLMEVVPEDNVVELGSSQIV